MQGLESTRNASTESITRASSITEQTSALLNEKRNVGGAPRGDQSATSLSFDHDVYGGEKAGGCSRADNACAWKPDANSHSQKAETWRAQREAQRDKPLDRPDGKYEVKPGDSMNDISRRYLKEMGVNEPSNKDIAGMSKALADQNKDSYSILKCNPNLIQPGMKFEMPPADKIAGLMPKEEYGTLGPSLDSGAAGTEFGPSTLKDGRSSGKAYGSYPAEQLPGAGNDKSGGTGTDVIPGSLGGGTSLDLVPGNSRSRGGVTGYGNPELGPIAHGGTSELSVGVRGGYESIVGGGLKTFKDASGPVGECKRDEYHG
ncbi:MAG: LysM peptidoglycan-binding domain-containing protein, partial [Cyanobacteria bacterium SZAS-4]|nr:LysM peptidoglycan-binding domain-containing protein [Cyanobacteria bacterium SZAS-4]